METSVAAITHTDLLSLGAKEIAASDITGFLGVEDDSIGGEENS